MLGKQNFAAVLAAVCNSEEDMTLVFEAVAREGLRLLRAKSVSIFLALPGF